MTDGDCWVVTFDTDRIKEYLLSSPDLRRIRGASTLLELLNRGEAGAFDEWRDHWPAFMTHQESALTILRTYAEPGLPPIAAGGMAAAVLNAEADPQTVITDVERAYRATTSIASITGVSVRCSRRRFENDFGSVMKETGRALRREKDEKSQDFRVPLAPYLHPCDACRRHPAQEIDDRGDGLVCRACHTKGELGRSGRSIYWKKFLAGAGQEWQETRPPGDFNEVGDLARPSGYVGFIYADANGVGSILDDHMKSYQGFHDFSAGLDQLVQDTVHGALRTEARPSGNNVAPFEILLMGGDDVMLLVAADLALPVAMNLTRGFSSGAERLVGELGLALPRRLGLSTGVVIARAGFPVRVMYELASGLLRSAKAESARKGNAIASAVDFMVVTEANTAGLEAVRDGVLSEKGMWAPPMTGERVCLTERPYTIERLEKLMRSVAAVKSARIPRHLVRALYEDVFHSRLQAQLTGLRLRQKDGHRAVWDEVMDKLTMDPGFFPWRRSVEDGQVWWRTPIPDLVEIFDFVEGAGR